MSEPQDHYALLGIPENAPHDHIRQRYKVLSRQMHPDKVDEAKRPEATEKFRLISESYAVLGDADKRAEYDRQRRAQRRRPRSRLGSQNAADDNADVLFDRMFSGFGQAQKQARRQSASVAPESPIEIGVNCTLEELKSGVHKTVTTNSRRSLVVYIPPGTPNNKCLCIDNGQIVIRVVEMAHPVFKRDGNNLRTRVRLHLRSALLVGSRIRVPLLGGGSKTIQLQHIAAPDSTVFIPNEGMPAAGARGTRCGSLIVGFDLIFPTTLTITQRNALAALLPVPEDGSDCTVLHIKPAK